MAKCNDLQILDGQLFIQELDGITGALTDVERAFGGTDTITLTSTSEKLDHYCSEGGDDVTVRPKDGNDTIQQDVAITLVTSNITNKTLALANLATETITTQVASIGTTLTLTAVALGGVYPIGVRKITNLVVKDVTDTTTYTKDVDYKESLTWGTVEIIDGGAISASDDLHLTYDVPAIDVSSFSANTENNKYYQLSYRGYASVGKSVEYVIPKVQLTISGDQTLKAESSAYTQLTFEGSVLSNGTDPIYTMNVLP